MSLSPYWLPNYTLSTRLESAGAGVGFGFLNARYYKNERGKFLSQDPMFWILPDVVLVNPQLQNSYSYSSNNPINASDPSGLLSIVVHGTDHGGDGVDWSPGTSANTLLQNATQAFGEQAVPFNWSVPGQGNNNAAARANASQALNDFINSYNFADGEQLNIVGFSHGGNVAIGASNSTSRKIDNLVTLGTPVRSDYQPNYNQVGNHVNVYSNFDFVQTVGGSNGYGLVGGLFGGLPGYYVGNIVGPALFPGFEFGAAGRTYNDAKNVHVSGNPFNLDPRAVHVDLQRSSVWSEMIE